MKTYSFMTKENNRIDVTASTPVVAWNKLNKVARVDYVSDSKGGAFKIKAEFNGLFITYDKDGMAGIETWTSINPFLKGTI
jgi:hypothetical protein